MWGGLLAGQSCAGSASGDSDQSTSPDPQGRDRLCVARHCTWCPREELPGATWAQPQGPAQWRWAGSHLTVIRLCDCLYWQTVCQQLLLAERPRCAYKAFCVLPSTPSPHMHHHFARLCPEPRSPAAARGVRGGRRPFSGPPRQHPSLHALCLIPPGGMGGALRCGAEAAWPSVRRGGGVGPTRPHEGTHFGMWRFELSLCPHTTRAISICY